MEFLVVTVCFHEQLLRVTIDSELKFENHITELCLKVSKTLNAEQTQKAFIESQFDYCGFIWMLFSSLLSNKINCIHERALKTVCSGYKSSVNKLLDMDGSFTIHL